MDGWARPAQKKQVAMRRPTVDAIAPAMQSVSNAISILVSDTPDIFVY
jgi:hypothetical protein